MLVVGGLLVVGGAVLLTPVLGGGVIGTVLVPLFTIAVGAIVAWSNLDDAQRSRWLGSGEGRYGWMRVALGAGLTVAGILVLVTRGESISAVWDALLAAIAVLVGALIIAAPWALRLWGDLRREQVAAARATERADIAAHLHDSVLQTLALIQRQSHDPRRRHPAGPRAGARAALAGCTPARRARSRRSPPRSPRSRTTSRTCTASPSTSS